ncbi:MAG: VOC family protein [Proteobacteria bacterium]|nr:VOC family protein [Pseudomonadota bacterium]
MSIDIISAGKIVQIAYFVNDIRTAAIEMNRVFGNGPFYLYENIELKDVTYRGNAATLDHSSAYGQSGDIMIEFIQQNSEGPSAFRDMYADGEEGIHHVAMFVSNVQEEIRRLKKLGFQVANHFYTRAGVEVVFIDTTEILGHMTELYEPVKPLKKFYSMVASAAVEWDGKELFRHI